jgi:hypothetical protein
MIGNESCDLLGENNHCHNEYDSGPKKHRTQIIPFHRTEPRTALLPESNAQQHDGKRQKPGTKLLQKCARSRRPQRASKSQRKTAPHRRKRAQDGAKRCGDAGGLLDPHSPLRCRRFLIFWIHFILAYFREVSILFLNSRALEIVVASSTVRSFLSRITTRPPMITVSTSLPFNA